MADVLSAPFFLESSKVGNVPLYEHLGYAVTAGARCRTARRC